MSPILEFALGIFMVVFGPLVFSVARTDPSSDEGRVRFDGQIALLLVAILTALCAAVVSGYVYITTQDTRFLIIALVTGFIAVGAIAALWGISRRRPLRLHAQSLQTAAVIMIISGALSILTFPLLYVDTIGISQQHLLITWVGVGASFTAIGVLLIGVIFAD